MRSETSSENESASPQDKSHAGTSVVSDVALPQGWILGNAALRFLTWRVRLQHAYRRGLANVLPTGKGLREGGRFAPQTPLTTVDPQFHEPGDALLCKDLQQAFTELLTNLLDHPIPLEDASAFAQKLLVLGGRPTTLTSWLSTVVRQLQIEIAFEDSEPVISLASLKGWLAATDVLDADSLAVFAIASASDTPLPLLEALRWGAAIRITDPYMTELTSKGVTDLHVHLGAGRSATERWHSLLSGRIQPRHLNWTPSHSNRHRVDNLEFWRNVVEDVVEASRCSNSPTTPRVRPGSRLFAPLFGLAPPDSSTSQDIGFVPRKLWRERVMLFRAFRSLAHGGLSAKPLETAIDLYVGSKSWFFAEYRQPIAAGPGLAKFRGYFSKSKMTWHRRPRSANELSARSEAREYAEWLSFIAQSKFLRRLELRIGPLERPQHYKQFFSVWERIERDLNLRARNLKIGFAVHFKRSLDRSRHSKDKTAALRSFLREIDHQTATLQEYIAHQALAKQSHRVSRVDLAGQERDLPLDHAVFCLNLLRGVPTAVLALQSSSTDADLHRRWLLLSRLGRASQPPTSHRLGITCHTGEDFAHPLEGLHSMDCAIRALQLGPGDTIGHGLAAGWDIDAFNRTRFASTLTTRGTQFDSLLWLFLWLRNSGPAGDFEARLAEWLRKEFAQLYPEIQTPPSLDGISGIWQERWNAAPKRSARIPLNDTAANMRWHELWNNRCAAARGDRVPLDSILIGMTPAIARLQKAIISVMLDKGIAFEFNPSSNWRIAGSPQPAELPFMPILTSLKELALATICSDNPGTFCTRIENEYAIVFQGLRDSGLSRPAALSVLERLRSVGHSLA